MPLNGVRKIIRLGLALLVAASVACGPLNSAENTDSGDVHFQLGVRYLSMNKLEIARENLLLALKTNQHNIQAHNALAFLYEKLNQFDNAKSHYLIALDLKPDDLSVRNNLGRFYCEHDEPIKGLALLSEAGSDPINDRQWMALTNAGRCLLGMGQNQEAENYFRQALQLNPTYAPALSEMQKIAYQNGDFWGAKGFLQRYLALADHTSETLWFASMAERALGNKELSREYKNLLLEKFPLSNEAKKILRVKDF